MSVSTKLTKYLDENKIKYTSVTHSLAYTAQEIAASLHVHGKELAKAVILKADGKFIMAVAPASYKIDMGKIKDVLKVKEIILATESEFEKLFPDCEIGGMPPFGNLYDLPTFVSDILSQDKEIIFNAGTHRDAIRMSYSDYEKLVKPVIGNFTYHV